LVHIHYYGFERDAALPWGIKDAVDIEWDVLTGPETGENERLQVSNVMLVRQLKDQQPGREFFGRVSTQPSGKGNPAVFLGDPRPGDEQFINAFLARRGGGAQQPPQQQPQQQPTNYPGQQGALPQGGAGAQQGPLAGNGYGAPAGMPPAAPPAQQPAPAQQGSYDPPPF
jgi:hypothetical protein